MQSVLIVIQIFLVLTIIILVLMQKSGSDGTANLAGGGNSLISSRTSATFLSKATMLLAILFMVNSLLLARLSYQQGGASRVIIEQIEKDEAKTPPKLD